MVLFGPLVISNGNGGYSYNESLHLCVDYKGIKRLNSFKPRASSVSVLRFGGVALLLCDQPGHSSTEVCNPAAAGFESLRV